jgi:hypothetical protein
MTYSTNFPKTENPISEGGRWKNGAADGIDFTNCRTTPGSLFGTESGTRKGSQEYDDSTCILNGTWGPLQTVEATVFSRSQRSDCLQEVELRLRSTMTPHNSTGYEVLFRAYHPGGYATIVRWNGPLGNFTYLNQKPNNNYHGIQNGDVVKATIDGQGLIVGYVNGVEVIRATDTTYTNGNPGAGFWLRVQGGHGGGTNADYGFSSFTATDGVKAGAAFDAAGSSVLSRKYAIHRLERPAHLWPGFDSREIVSGRAEGAGPSAVRASAHRSRARLRRRLGGTSRAGAESASTADGNSDGRKTTTRAGDCRTRAGT